MLHTMMGLRSVFEAPGVMGQNFANEGYHPFQAGTIAGQNTKVWSLCYHFEMPLSHWSCSLCRRMRRCHLFPLPCLLSSSSLEVGRNLTHSVTSHTLRQMQRQSGTQPQVEFALPLGPPSPGNFCHTYTTTRVFENASITRAPNA